MDIETHTFKQFMAKRMIKTITTFIFILFCTTIVVANKIDSLKKTEDLIPFLKTVDTIFGKYTVGTIATIYEDDSINIRMADSIGVMPWKKFDIDGNGLTDILIFLVANERTYLVAILDEGDKFIYKSLNRSPFGNTYYPLLTQINRQPCLILIEGVGPYRLTTLKRIINTDTLVFKYGDFIELNNGDKNFKIEKIKISTGMCFGVCPIFELTINSDRSAYYKAVKFNNETGKFKTIIDSIKFDEIYSLLNYIEFPKLKDKYSVNWTDDQTCILSITYNNNNVKTITDYGEIGTNGLRLVYKKMFDLRKNQKWKSK